MGRVPRGIRGVADDHHITLPSPRTSQEHLHNGVALLLQFADQVLDALDTLGDRHLRPLPKAAIPRIFGRGGSLKGLGFSKICHLSNLDPPEKMALCTCNRRRAGGWAGAGVRCPTS